MAKRVSLLGWAALAAALAAAGAGIWLAARPPGPESHPSILLVTIDTIRADHSSVYGYERPTTPRLDALAARGVRFAAAYAPMATTAPSHATMFTSRLPRSHGLLKNGQVLATGSRGLAEVLRENGYASAAFVSSFAVHRRFGFDRGFDSYDDVFRDRRGDETSKLVVDWLRIHGYLDGGASQSPFFVWVHFMDPHEPYQVPPGEPTFEPDAPDDELQRAIAAYDGEIRFADRQMGAIFDALDAAGRFDQVLTIVVGDHGEGLMQHDHMSHGLFIYEETVRVPFVFHWPRGLARSLVIEEPVEIIDLAPTVLELADLAPVSEFQGTSLARVLRGQAAADPERPIYLERRLYDTSLVDGFHVAGKKFGLRRGRWKYIEARDEGSYELYDLATDPGERTNVFASRPEESAELARVLHAWTDGAATPSASPVSPEDAERLRELGYVQ